MALINNATYYSKKLGPNSDVVSNTSEALRSQNKHVMLTLDPELDLDLSGKGTNKPMLSGTIHPFHKSHTTLFGKIHEEFKSLLSIRKTRRICVCLFINLSVIFVMLQWCHSTNSIALLAYTCLVCYDALALIACLVSSWSSMKQEKLKAFSSSSNLSESFSYERTEILAVFSSVVIAQLAAVFITKEAIERFIEQQDIHIGRLIPGVVIGFCSHFLLSCFIENKTFRSVREASYSSWMQEHAADLSRNICGVLPILRGVLLPRVDPLFLVHFCGAAILILLDVVLQIESYFILDTVISLLIVLMIFGTMWPITVCSGNVLLQTTSPYVLGQLDKLLSEAQTLDGVLEIQNESFFTLSLGGSKSFKMAGPVLAGSLQVRVRRDADEQLVLAHVTNRLSPLVPHLTVQVVKDNWSASTTPSVSKVMQNNPMTSKFISGFNKPAAAVVPFSQTPPKSVTVNVEDDFSFTSPVKGATVVPVVKPRTSHTDIEKMYKAAGFKTKPVSKYTMPNTKYSVPYFPKQTEKNFPVFTSASYGKLNNAKSGKG